jgi:hypothetical protein
MQPLTPDDLLPLAEYAPRREEFFQAHRRYCDLYRRVRVGPSAALLFENRQTLWFRIQEILRVTQLRDPKWVQQELAIVNRLLPRANQLQAGLILNDPSGTAWRKLQPESIRLVLGSIHVSPRIASCQPGEQALGLAHWLEFPLYRPERKLLADFSVSAWIEIECGAYRHNSGRLTEEVRQSLLDDLESSDKDAA